MAYNIDEKQQAMVFHGVAGPNAGAYASYPPPGSLPPSAAPGGPAPVYFITLPQAPPGLGSAAPPPAVDAGGGGCCGQRKLLRPLRSPSEVARPALRALAGAALGLGLLALFSGGWAVLSSIFVIAQAAQWRAATKEPRSIDEVVGEVKAMAGTGCCGKKRHLHLRSLAVAAIVFASLELLLGMMLGWGLGGALGQPLPSAWLTSSSNRVEVCNGAQCITGVTSATWGYMRQRSTQVVREPLAIFRAGEVGAANCALCSGAHGEGGVPPFAVNALTSLPPPPPTHTLTPSTDLFYASAATIFCSCANIALSAAMLRGVDLLVQLSLA